MKWYWFALALVLGVVALVLYLLRTQRIQEKYAAIWIGLAVGVTLVGVFPQLAGIMARAVGVQTPINLVFALASLVLFVVIVQLSVEVSRAEEKTRTLAERIALLQLELRELAERTNRADLAERTDRTDTGRTDKADDRPQ